MRITYSGLHCRYPKLFLHGVDAFKIGKKHAATRTLLEDHAIDARVEFFDAVYALGVRKNIHGEMKVRHLRSADRRKTRVTKGRRDGV